MKVKENASKFKICPKHVKNIVEEFKKIIINLFNWTTSPISYKKY